MVRFDLFDAQGTYLGWVEAKSAVHAISLNSRAVRAELRW